MTRVSDSEAKQESRSSTWLLGGLVLLGLLTRLILLVASDFGIESDEAVVGLMAKHVTDGKPWPLFYYGQHYMGSLEALLAAASFSVFGMSNASLKLVPLLFSLLHIALVYLLAKRFCGSKVALCAALLTAVAPSTLVLWSSKARGGFIELVALGTLCLIITVDIVRAKVVPQGAIAVLGFLLGLGWWINNQVAFYIAPIGLVLLMSLPSKLGVRATASRFVTGILSFLVGGLPFWYANIFLEPQWATFDVLFAGTGDVDALKHFEGFLTQALPILLGARRFWADADVFPGASLLAYSLYGASLLLVILAMLQSRSVGLRRVSTGNALSLFLLLLFVCSTAFIFSRSSFGWLSRAPRYLLPLYSVLPVLVAVAISRLLEFRGRVGGILATFLFSGVLALNLSSNYLGGVAQPGQPSVFRGQRVASSHDELYDWLSAKGYGHIATNYWIGYRTAFETNEQVQFTRLGRPRSLRIPEYENFAPQAVVLVPAEARLYERELRQFGFRYNKTLLGEYVAFDEIERELPLGDVIARSEFSVRASTQSQWIDRMFDSDSETRWGSGAPQSPNMALEIVFNQAREVSGLTMDLGPFVHDAPRRLRIEGQDAKGIWLEIADFSETKIFYDLRDSEFAEIPRVWKFSFKPRRYKALRMLQLESTSVFDWSLAELRVHGSGTEKD